MWSLAWELAPCHWGVTRGEGLPSEAWGFLLAGRVLAGRPETMGGCGQQGWHSRLAGKRNLPVPPPSREKPNPGGAGPQPGWGRPFSLQAAVCVHGNLRASTGGFPII